MIRNPSKNLIAPGEPVEYPKWVNGKNGRVVVNDAEEEASELEGVEQSVSKTESKGKEKAQSWPAKS